ncbi:MAG: hypothetical protein JXR89_11590 [Deltaproteobacteria bacterium]|nr:hypothetical protein [Deltaproteobacteria bacterium]
MTEEKNEKNSAGAPVVANHGGEQKKKGGLLPFVTTAVFLLLVLAAVLGFLDNRKLHSQLLEVNRKIASMEAAEVKTGKRLLALEDEMVVWGLKRRLQKIGASVRSLLDLQGLLNDNQDLRAVVSGVVESLGAEQKKLEEEIAGSAPRNFQSSRPVCPPCPQACPQARMSMPPSSASPCPSTSADKVTDAAPVSGATFGAAPKTGAESESGWSKIINFRIFGH